MKQVIQRYIDSFIDMIYPRNIATAVPFNRCVAFTWHTHGSSFGHLVYQLKYYDKPEIGRWMGQLMAEELNESHFFDGIDVIIPLPISKKRQQWRGYNQSEEIAKGITTVIPLPICSSTISSPQVPPSHRVPRSW